MKKEQLMDNPEFRALETQIQQKKAEIRRLRSAQDGIRCHAYYEENRDLLIARSKAYNRRTYRYDAEYERKLNRLYREKFAAVGQFLRRCRNAVGITQARLGEELGVTCFTISRYESGERRADLTAYLDALSRISGMSIAHICKEVESL